jgi:transposase InsO family protein
MIDLLRELKITPTRTLFNELHSDNGSEFINAEMESLLEDQ